MLNRIARDMRERLGLSQMELGIRLHCSPQDVSDYELGRRPVPNAYLAALTAIVAINLPDDPTPSTALNARCEACEIHAGRNEISLLAQRRIRRAA